MAREGRQELGMMMMMMMIMIMIIIMCVRVCVHVRARMQCPFACLRNVSEALGTW